MPLCSQVSALVGNPVPRPKVQASGSLDLATPALLKAVPELHVSNPTVVKMAGGSGMLSFNLAIPTRESQRPNTWSIPEKLRLTSGPRLSSSRQSSLSNVAIRQAVTVRHAATVGTLTRAFF